MNDNLIAPMPPWLNEESSKNKVSKIIPETIFEGERNETLTSLGGSLSRRGLTPEEIFPSLKAVSQIRFETPVSDDEIRGVAESVGRYSPAPTRGFNRTDAGNAKRFVKQHGAYVRFCFLWGKWLIWNGKRWVIDETGLIERLAKATASSIYDEANEIEDPEDRKKCLSWARSSESRGKITSMIDLAKSEPEIPILPEELDASLWLLNVLNGTIDLVTGRLLSHRSQDYITKLAPVEYEPDATCPMFLEFLSRIMGGNQNLIEFIQKAIGYSLTGDTREQVLFLLYGTGANGKSTLMETIRSLLGDYSKQTDFSTFLARNSDSVRNDLARLLGARFVSAVEAEQGRRLSEVSVKQVTGGDTISARFLFKEFFEYKPAFKVFLAANHKPEIRGVDDGIWRRIRLVPFTVTIPLEERDGDLPEKLRGELSGILNWAIEGCLAWKSDGLGVPDEVAEATQGYREEMDILGDFISERCETGIWSSVGATPLYKEYIWWCEENGEKPKSQKVFGGWLKERGFQSDRGAPKGATRWLGIGLK